MLLGGQLFAKFPGVLPFRESGQPGSNWLFQLCWPHFLFFNMISLDLETKRHSGAGNGNFFLKQKC